MRIHHLDEGVGRIVKGVNTTPDVGVDQTRIEAAKFGNTVDKDGRPPTMSTKVKGKSTNVLFNLGLTEGIRLKLERDKHMDVLHIWDTNEKHRVEVRGKKGYETNGYDPDDKLHQVLDSVGRAASVSDLMNGDIVDINPHHPQGDRAIRTARDVLQTEQELVGGDLFNALEEKWSQKYKRSINCNNPKGFSQKAHCAGRKKSEDMHPNERPLGPEIKPTMPAGSIRVKVSDVYDWYKLGQHISDLAHLDANDFGKGPPEAVIAFGSEEEEHKYIKLLQKLGLEILDVDPKAADAPGVKTDPTYNTEEIAETIRKVGSKYVIYSKKGKRLGSYSSRSAAEKRLGQIEYFKHKGG